jgi:hypothetical protein
MCISGVLFLQRNEIEKKKIMEEVKNSDYIKSFDINIAKLYVPSIGDEANIMPVEKDDKNISSYIVAGGEYLVRCFTRAIGADIVARKGVRVRIQLVLGLYNVKLTQEALDAVMEATEGYNLNSFEERVAQLLWDNRKEE